MKHAPIQSLDDYFLSRPDTRPKMRWPVSDNPFTMKTVEWFDSWGEAVDAVNAALGTRNLYIGEPVRWERVEL